VIAVFARSLEEVESCCPVAAGYVFVSGRPGELPSDEIAGVLFLDGWEENPAYRDAHRRLLCELAAVASSSMRGVIGMAFVLSVVGGEGWR
jgi:hypothetical protein